MTLGTLDMRGSFRFYELFEMGSSSSSYVDMLMRGCYVNEVL